MISDSMLLGVQCGKRNSVFIFFGEMDVVADTLPELADKIIAASK
jgi:hypothetical protein